MKKLFQLMLAAILTLSGTLAGLTSCSDNEDNATPQKSVVGDLEGQWSVNLSKQLNVDFAFLTFNFTKDNQLELGLTTYNYNSDSYEQTYIRGMVAKLADKEYDNRMVQRIEMTFDEATKQVLGISGDDASARDTLYFESDVNNLKFLLGAFSKDIDADGDGEIEDFAYAMTKGTLNVESLDKKATREFIDMVRAAIIAENENMPAATRASAATRATHRELANWMKDVPDSKLVRNMLLPGTHDAATWSLPGNWNIALGKTQRYNYGEQWDYGIRYYDLRTRYRAHEGTDMLFHSMLDCNMSLDRAIDDIVAKVKQHKTTDGVVVRIKAEGNDFGVSSESAFWKLPGFNGGTYFLDVRDFLQKAADFGAFKFDFYPLDSQKTIQRAVELVEKKLLDAGLLAKWAPDMSMKDLRGKVLVMFEGDVSGVDYGRVADYVVHQHNHKLYTPAQGFSNGVEYKEQNDYEAEKRTLSEYSIQKENAFEKCFAQSKDQTQDYWVFNAANGYEFECFYFPNYASLAACSYADFAGSVETNPGCRGLVVLDYAGDDYIRRVNIYKMATGIVLVSTAGRVAAWIFSKVSGYSEKETLRGMFEKGYAGLELFTDPYYVSSQYLVKALVDGNFVSPISN